jgi:SH3-like domain-containing protein
LSTPLPTIRQFDLSRMARAAIAGVLIVIGWSFSAKAAGEAGNGSGLQIPRFVSLKSDKVNVRAGPTKDHEVTWVYTRTGLPVEITAEFENWRRIRDWEGAEGWVYHSLLSGRRTGLVSPPAKTADKAASEEIPIHANADVDSAIVARLQPGVLGAVKRCNGSWCRVTGAGYDGWVAQNRLWGVYPNEKVE